MICRNCSAIIEDGCEKCPSCGKNPGKRGAKGGGKAVALIVLALLVLGAGVVFALNMDFIKEKFGALFASAPTSDATTLDYNDTGVAEETTTEVPETKETTKAIAATEPVEKISLLKARINTLALKKDGNKIVFHGTLELKKSQLKALTHTQFSDFCAKRVSQLTYAWLTLKCEDNTGIVFTGNCITTATYCTLDENDYIGQSLGTILLTESGEYVFIPAESRSESVESETATAPETTVVKPETTRGKPESTAAESTAAPKKDKKDSSKTVFVEKGEKTYHKSSCKLLTKAKKSIEKSEAVKNGFEPCKKCKP